jgi:hypothetical protein
MTMSPEELLVILFVVGAGNPVLIKSARGICRRISSVAKRRRRHCHRGFRFRIREIEIWFEKAE